MLRLRVSEDQSRDLIRVADIAPSALDEILKRLNDSEKPILSPTVFRKFLEQSVDSESARALRRLLLSFGAITRRRRYTSEDIVTAVTDEIEQHWTEGDLAKWNNVSRVIGNLILHERTRVAAKSLELAFDYSNLLRHVDILTDIRPIFDTDHDRVEGTIISQTLRLRIQTESEIESISIMMDETDLRRLLELCEVALKKAKISRDTMIGKCDVDAFVVGDNFYD